MRFAARLNSFLGDNGSNIEQTLDLLGRIEKVSHVDLNYPEHFENHDVEEIRKYLKRNDLQLNGVALRFRKDFIRGELGNGDEDLAQRAKELCFQAIDVCRQLEGRVVTIWLGYDGWDYSFQADYGRLWDQAAAAFKEICAYGKGLKISIEYKPFQPRAYSLISSFGSTMMMLQQVQADNLGVTLDFCHMLMKNENPAFGACLAARQHRLYGVHLNDGCKFNDDGLMVGTVNFIQTLEFLYYLKKYGYDGVVYFDTFPIRENREQEVEANIHMVCKLDRLIDKIGMEEIQRVIESDDAIEVQRMICNCIQE